MKERITCRVDGKPISYWVDETNTVTDGHHTFGELYDHRITLFIALAKGIFVAVTAGTWDNDDGKYTIWRSKQHADGDMQMYEGWFVMGINIKLGQQITYHLPLSRWEETNFANTLERAPKWDGHTPQDVLERLKKL